MVKHPYSPKTLYNNSRGFPPGTRGNKAGGSCANQSVLRKLRVQLLVKGVQGEENLFQHKQWKFEEIQL